MWPTCKPITPAIPSFCDIITYKYINLQGVSKPRGDLYQNLHLKISNDILLELDERNIVFLNFLDLSAAFDTLDLSIMLRRLELSLGIEGQALQGFHSYLSDRRVKVNVNGQYSDIVKLRCFYCPLLHELNLWYHAYADDTQASKTLEPRTKMLKFWPFRKYNLEFKGLANGCSTIN